jgi:hypothetical protein
MESHISYLIIEIRGLLFKNGWFFNVIETFEDLGVYEKAIY